MFVLVLQRGRLLLDAVLDLLGGDVDRHGGAGADGGLVRVGRRVGAAAQRHAVADLGVVRLLVLGTQRIICRKRIKNITWLFNFFCFILS